LRLTGRYNGIESSSCFRGVNFNPFTIGFKNKKCNCNILVLLKKTDSAFSSTLSHPRWRRPKRWTPAFKTIFQKNNGWHHCDTKGAIGNHNEELGYNAQPAMATTFYNIKEYGNQTTERARQKENIKNVDDVPFWLCPSHSAGNLRACRWCVSVGGISSTCPDKQKEREWMSRQPGTRWIHFFPRDLWRAEQLHDYSLATSERYRWSLWDAAPRCTPIKCFSGDVRSFLPQQQQLLNRQPAGDAAATPLRWWEQV